MEDNDENIKICQADSWTGTSEDGNNADALCRAFETEMANRRAAEIEKASRNSGKTMQISAIEQDYINRIANGKERINHTAEQWNNVRMITMKKKYLIYVCIIILIPVFLLLYEKNEGTPPVITVDGVDLTLGISSPDDLYSQGFEFSLPYQYTLYNMLPANSWSDEYIPAVKDEELYAQLYVYNSSKEDVYCTGATIYQIEFEMYSGEDSFWTQNNILVNGINFYGMNIDEVKTAMQAYKKPKETSYGNLRYKDGKYSYYIYFGSNGLVEEVAVEMDISKSYDEVS